MPPAFYALLSMLGVLFRSQLSLRPRASLRETSWQICQRTVKRPIIRPEDLILWSWLSRCRARWRDVPVCSIPWSGSCSLRCEPTSETASGAGRGAPAGVAQQTRDD